jgi:CxxC motif-containing protein
MREAKNLICITCPKGCEARVWAEEGSLKVRGKICKKGKSYLKQEFQEPRRTLTTTVLTQDSRLKRFPVRTSGSIPKKDLLRAMDYLSSVKVRPPVKASDVIVRDLLQTGVDVIACDDLME